MVLTDESAVPDVYCDGVGSVELLGENVRIIYYTWHGPIGERQKIVAAKLVIPRSQLDESILVRLLREQELLLEKATAGLASRRISVPLGEQSASGLAGAPFSPPPLHVASGPRTAPTSVYAPLALLGCQAEPLDRLHLSSICIRSGDGHPLTDCLLVN